MAKQYSKEERAEAVKLAKETSAKVASERLGINIDTIYTWVSKAKQAAAEEAELASPEGQARVRRLEKENRELREEVEILQDALGFFVKRRKK